MVVAIAPPGKGLLGKSSSVPSLRQRPRPAGAHAPAKQPPLEGVLFVAQQASQGAVSTWEPFLFKHYPDGAISFRPTLASGDAASSELFLNADWKRPFVAAPWQSFAVGDEPQVITPDGSRASGELHPFTLSYAPLHGTPGDEEPLLAQRRTLMLAASDGRTRERWLASLSRKAKLLDPSASSSAGTVTNGTLPRAGPAPGPAKSAKAGRRSSVGHGARLLSLGDALPRLPAASKTCPGGTGFRGTGRHSRPMQHASQRRLPAGDGELWSSYSSYAVVRDLYDGYAADPLAAQEPWPLRSSQRESLSIHEAGDVSDDFFGKYVDRQAEIESLLEQRLTRTPSSSRTLPWLASSSSRSQGSLQESSTEGSRVLPPAPALSAESAAPLDGLSLRPVRLTRSTPNVRLDGEILTNSEWSGGAMFTPPDERNFRFTISVTDELETHPIFIGIAPADADLSIVNFFDVDGGIFLCMGGAANYTLLAACGARGGPCFHAYGRRDVSVLPVLTPGYTLSVAFETKSPQPGAQPEGRVYFVVGDKNGEGIFYDKPKLSRSLPAGGWRPCLLLCMPDTRVKVLPFK